MQVPVRGRKTIVLSFLLSLGVVATGCSAPAERTEVIRLADSYSPKHPFSVHGTAIFMDAMEQEGLEFEYFPAGQMGNARDLANMVRTNVVDVAPASAAYLEDQFPLTSVSDLPGTTNNACVAARALMKLLQPGGVLYEEEYGPRGMRPLWVNIVPNYEIMTTDKEIRVPADVEGLLLRSSGGSLDVTTTQLGAAAVSMPASDIYEALTRKTVDGLTFSLLSAASYDLGTVAKHSTEGLNLGAVGIPFVISEEKWQQFSPEVQEKLLAAGNDANESLCQNVVNSRDEFKASLEEGGMTFHPLTPEETAQWDELLTDIKTTWAESLDDAGKPGTEVLEAYEEELAKQEGALS